MLISKVFIHWLGTSRDNSPVPREIFKGCVSMACLLNKCSRQIFTAATNVIPQHPISLTEEKMTITTMMDLEYFSCFLRGGGDQCPHLSSSPFACSLLSSDFIFFTSSLAWCPRKTDWILTAANSSFSLSSSVDSFNQRRESERLFQNAAFLMLQKWVYRFN